MVQRKTDRKLVNVQKGASLTCELAIDWLVSLLRRGDFGKILYKEYLIVNLISCFGTDFYGFIQVRNKVKKITTTTNLLTIEAYEQHEFTSFVKVPIRFSTLNYCN